MPDVIPADQVTSFFGVGQSSTPTADLPDVISASEASNFFGPSKTETPTANKPFRYDVPTIQSTTETSEQKNERIATSDAEIQKQAKKARSPLGFLANAGKAAGETIASAEVALGNTIAGTKNTNKNSQSYVDTLKTYDDSLVSLTKQIRAADQAGTDSTKLKQIYNDTADKRNQAQAEYEQMSGVTKKTTGQVLGELGGVALDTLSAGTYGEATKGAKAFSLLPKSPTIVKAAGTVAKDVVEGKILPETTGLFTKKGALNIAKGAANGYAYDVAGNAREGDTGTSVFKPGLGTIIGAGLPALFEGSQSVKNVTSRSKAIDSLEQKYEEIFSGTKTGKKRLDKSGVMTDLKNKAGTDGRTPQRVLAENGIIPEQSGTKFDTFGQAENFRQTVAPLQEANRAALAEVETGVPKTSLHEMEEQAVARAKSAENIDSGKAPGMEKEIRQAFADLRSVYGDEVSLTKLDEIKSARWKRAPFDSTRPLQSDANYTIAKTAQQKIEQVANDAGYGEVAQLNREIGDRLEAAKHLESLNGNTIKGGRLGKYVAGTIGATLGHTLPGKVLGWFGGNLVADILMSQSVAGPVKRLILNNLETKNPEAYAKAIAWLETQGAKRSQRLLLPAGRVAEETSPTLFVTPKGKTTPVMQEATDLVATESGNAKKPQFGKSKSYQGIYDEPYAKPNEMPVIKTGAKPKAPAGAMEQGSSSPTVYTPEPKPTVAPKPKKTPERYIAPEDLPVIDYGRPVKKGPTRVMEPMQSEKKNIRYKSHTSSETAKKSRPLAPKRK